MLENKEEIIDNDNMEEPSFFSSYRGFLRERASIPLPKVFLDDTLSSIKKVTIQDVAEKPIKSAQILKKVSSKRLLVLKVGNKVQLFKMKTVWIVEGEVYIVIHCDVSKKSVALTHVFSKDELREKIISESL